MLHHHRHTPARIPASYEAQEDVVRARAEARDAAYEAGHEVGMAEAEHDLVGFARKFVADPAETTDERCRRFLAEFIGRLDCSYGDLSAALAEAAGLFQDDAEA